MIRKAVVEDAFPCSKLYFMSGPKLMKYLFPFRNTQDIPKFIEFLFKQEANSFSYENAFVDEEETVIRGAINVIPAKKIKILEENIGKKYGKFFFNYSGLSGLMKMFFRMGIQSCLNIHKDDEYYIENLAVFPEYRGKSISTNLLGKAAEKAQAQDFPKLTLLVLKGNDHAEAVYSHFGFKEQIKVDLPRKYHKFGLEGFKKMVYLL